MKKAAALLAILLLTALAPKAGGEEPRLLNPYERPKNGPPLTRVTHKVRPAWLLEKLTRPGHHPSARMPDLRLSREEALDIMAYLEREAGAPAPEATRWPPHVEKDLEQLDDGELGATLELVERGKAVFGNARCTVCHSINGPGGERTGGFVDLRVGGIDLEIAGGKLKRDWLYRWLEEPKAYFEDTLMPRFRFSEEERRALVEYLLRDDAFRPPPEGDGEEAPLAQGFETLDDPERAARGRRLIELSRCVVCHDVGGIPEVLGAPERAPAPPPGSFASLAHDLRCLSCHSIEGRGGTYAPDLTSEGSRLEEAWIAKFVKEPDMIRPLSQQMPKFNLTAEEAKVVASYMKTSRRDARIPDEIPGGPPTPEEVKRGRDLFMAKGCLACHGVGEGPGGEVGPSLARVASRLEPGYLWFHLRNPRALNPQSAEPDLGLTDEECRALAAYLETKR